MNKIPLKTKICLIVLFLVVGGGTVVLLRQNRAKAAGITGAYYALHSNMLLVSGSGFGVAQGASTVSVDGTSLGAATSWADGDIYYSAPAKSTGTVTVAVDGGGTYTAAISQLSTYTPYPSDPDLGSSDLVSYYPFDSDFADKKSAINLTTFSQKLYGSGKFGGKYEAIQPISDPSIDLDGGTITLKFGNQILSYYYDGVLKYSISSDSGQTFGAPVAAPAAPYGMPKQMDNGQWIYLINDGYPAPSFGYCHATNVTIDNVFNPPDIVCGQIDAAAWTAMSGTFGSFYIQWGFDVYSGGRIIWPVYKYGGAVEHHGAGMIYSDDYGQTWGFKQMSEAHAIPLTLAAPITAGDTQIQLSSSAGLYSSGTLYLSNAGNIETVSYGYIDGNTLKNVRQAQSDSIGEFVWDSRLGQSTPGTKYSYAVLGMTIEQGNAARRQSLGEPTVVVDPHNRDHLILFERCEGASSSFIYRSESLDFGDTWSALSTIYIGDKITGEPVRGNNHFATWTADAGGAEGRIYIFARHWSGTKYFYSDDYGLTWHGSNAQASTKTDNNYTVRVGDTGKLSNDFDSRSLIPASDGSGLWLYRLWAIDDAAAPGTGTVRVTPMANVFFSFADSTSGKNLGYANSAYDARQNLSTYSLDFWANIRETHRNIDGTIVSRTSTDGTKANYDIKIVGNGANQNKIQFRQYNDLTSSWNTIYSSAALSNDTWYHVVATYDGAKMRLYMNGILNSELTSTSTHSGVETLQIGYDVGSDMRLYRGQLDNLKIWGKALTDAEILMRTNWAAPVITSVTPSTVYAGNTLAILGTGFGDQQAGSTVTIGGVSATVVSWSDTIIIVTVPSSFTTGSYGVIITVGNFASNMVSVDVLSANVLPVTGGGFDLKELNSWLLK